MIKKLKEKKGSFAIISAILVFIVVMCIAFYADTISNRWILNEVQSVMDASGTNTLKQTVDTDYLRKEILATDKTNPIEVNIKQLDTERYKRKIKQAYIDELSTQVSTNETITSLNVKDVDVYFDYDTFGLGESKKSRPQITLKALTTLKVASHPLVNSPEMTSEKVFNARNNETFQVEYGGMDENGNVQLNVYSVTRLVYR